MFRVPRRNIHPSSLAFVVSSRSPPIKALNFVFILFPESPVPPINKGDGDKLVFSSSPSSLLLYLNNFSNPNLASFVFPVGLIHFKSSTTTNFPSAAFADNATLNPSLLTFFCNLCSKSLGIGPCAVPPPRICGARRLPTRALPPPFCGLAFLVVPETSPLDFVFAVDVPLFRANCHRSTLCAISTRIGTSKCRPGRTIVPLAHVHNRFRMHDASPRRVVVVITPVRPPPRLWSHRRGFLRRLLDAVSSRRRRRAVPPSRRRRGKKTIMTTSTTTTIFCDHVLFFFFFFPKTKDRRRHRRRARCCCCSSSSSSRREPPREEDDGARCRPLHPSPRFRFSEHFQKKPIPFFFVCVYSLGYQKEVGFYEWF